MSKDPAFLLYVNNWIAGTMYLTHEAKGCYMDILILQFQRWRFSLKEASIVLGDETFQKQWPYISDKFIMDEDGFFYNERLRDEMLRRQKQSKAASYANQVRHGSETDSETKSEIDPLKLKLKLKEENNINEMYKSFIAGFNELTGRNFRGDKKAERQFGARLKDKYTGEDFALAIMNCLQDKFHQENPHFLTPEFITRQDKLEKYLNWKPSPTELKRARDVMFNLNKLFDDEQTSEN